MLGILAHFLARPAVTALLIRHARRSPYQHITGTDGSIYMERYWLFNRLRANGTGRRWGDWMPSIRLHRIMRPDADQDMHDHPWNARRFILRGWYREELEAHGNCRCRTHIWTRSAGETAHLAFGEYHRILEVSEGGVWTLFVTWKKRGPWGFLVDGKKVPWREYLGIEEPVPALPKLVKNGMTQTRRTK